MFPEYHNDDGYTLLSKDVEGALRRGFGRITGVVLIATIAVCWVSLVTWSVTDPSLTHATRDPATNLFGYPGAVISDLMLQTFGVVSAVLLLAPMLWGLDLSTSGRVSSPRWKILSFLASVLSLAGAFSIIPKFIAWPLNHGYGGIVGDGIAAVAGWGFGHAVANYADALGFVALLGCGLFFVFASLGVGVARMREVAARAVSNAKRSAGRNPRSYWAAGGVSRHEPQLRARAEPQLRPATAPASDQPAEPRLSHGSVAERHWREPDVSETSDFRNLEAARRKTDRARGTKPQQRGEPETPQNEDQSSADFVRAFELEDLDLDHWGEDFDADTDLESKRIAERFRPEIRMGTRSALREVLRNATRGLIEPQERPAAPVPQEKLALAEASGTDFAAVDAAHPEETGELAEQAADEVQDSGWSREEIEPTARESEPPVQPASIRPAAIREGPRPSTLRKSGGYDRPSLNLLKSSPPARPGPEMTEVVLRGTARLLEDVLERFGVNGTITEVRPGPVVTAYEVQLEKGTNPLRVVGLADDIGRAMNAGSVRVAVLSVAGGTGIVIELPNVHRHRGSLRDLLSGESYRSFGGNLPVALGLSTAGQPIIADLGGLTNILIAGRENTGKSTLLRSMLLSLVFRNSADDCRFVLFDPKLLEFGCFNGVPHLLSPVLSEPEKMIAALDWIVAEMDERAQRMAKLSARSVELFNNRVRNAKKRGEMIARTVHTGFCERTGQPIYEHEQMEFEPMPHIVVAIDELSDLMRAAPRQCETSLLRIAEKGRGVGIHLAAATKTTNGLCLTDKVRAAMASAIAFKLGSKVDSRHVLGEQGAEQLLEQGDVILKAGPGRSTRLHTPFVSQEEVEAVAEALRAGGPSRYAPSLMARLQEAVEPYPEAMAAAPSNNRSMPPAAE